MKLVKNACKCHRNSAVQKLVYDTLIKSKTDFDSNRFKDCFQIVLTAIADAKLVYSGVENDKDFCVFCHRQIANSENKENHPVQKKKRKNYSIYSVKVDEQDDPRHGRKSEELKPPPKRDTIKTDDMPKPKQKSKSKPKPKSKQCTVAVHEPENEYETSLVLQDDDLFWDYEDITEKHDEWYSDDDNVYYDYMCTSEDDIEYEEEEDLVMPESLPIKSDAVLPFMKLDTMVKDCKEEILNAWIFLNRLKERL